MTQRFTPPSVQAVANEMAETQTDLNKAIEAVEAAMARHVRVRAAYTLLARGHYLEDDAGEDGIEKIASIAAVKK